MSLKHILLGLLRDPHSGYDLKRTFDETLRHFWRAELSQIYPCLQRMEEEGLLKSETQQSPQGPNRRVYRRTAAGEGELRQWLAAEPVRAQPRLGYLAQVFFQSELGGLRKTRAFLLDLRQEFSQELAKYLAIERQLVDEHPGLSDATDPDNLLNPYLTLRFGIHRLQANLAWCDESLSRIEALLEQPTMDRQGG
jgi:DNA-binding PadR family transcriptional regulator